MEGYPIHYQEIFDLLGNVWVFVYHFRLLMHIKGHAINLPYFLLNDLKKMASSIQHSPRNLDRSLYHHGLVKILIETKLHQQNDNW